MRVFGAVATEISEVRAEKGVTGMKDVISHHSDSTVEKVLFFFLFLFSNTSYCTKKFENSRKNHLKNITSMKNAFDNNECKTILNFLSEVKLFEKSK